MTKKETDIKTYAELLTFPSFEERFNYLCIHGDVGIDTFGFDRYLNQMFYRTSEWKRIRDTVIARDYGRDLGFEGKEIVGKIIVHHMNPITKSDILLRSNFLLNPEFMVCTSKCTHDAIHFGDEKLIDKIPTERTTHDTCPWKH